MSSTTIHRLKNRPTGILFLHMGNCVLHGETVLPVGMRPVASRAGGIPMVASAVEGIDWLTLDVVYIEVWKDRFPSRSVRRLTTCPYLFPIQLSSCLKNPLLLI